MSKAGYPQWWNTTLTLYVHRIDSETDVVSWYRYVVTDCFWKYSGERVLINEVALDTNTVICRIPEDETYLSKYLWEAKSESEKRDYFTIGVGDIIIPGVVTDAVNEYNRDLGIKSTDLLSKYARLQGCMTVSTVAENVGGGRNNPHYLVTGERSSYGWKN